MNTNGLNTFKNHIAEKLNNADLQAVLKNNTSHYEDKFKEGINQFDDLEGCRERLAYIKKRTLNNLDKHLLEFENKFIRNGGAVYWADSTDDVIRILSEILPPEPGLIVKSKSMTSEEVDFNEEMFKRGDEVVETDLGEFIVQKMGQKPSHITAPAIHLSRKQIVQFFNTHFGTGENASAEEITGFVRKLLREKFTNAKVGVTGANFLIADTGSVAITENEGNASLLTAWPKKHIVIAGIEKMIPSLRDLYLFWPMLATHATGQKISAYNHIISGPARSAELDGPQEMAVILLNNNRHRLLEDMDLRLSLGCIRCGACLSVCPVYRRISGHAYPTVYSGPIGAVITPHLHSDESLSFVSDASTLCGKCTQRCPVNIPIHQLLVYNRHLAVASKEVSNKEYRLMRMVLKRMKLRKNMDFLTPKLKNFLLRVAFRKTWLRHHGPLEIPEKSYNAEVLERTMKKQ